MDNEWVSMGVRLHRWSKDSTKNDGKDFRFETTDRRSQSRLHDVRHGFHIYLRQLAQPATACVEPPPCGSTYSGSRSGKKENGLQLGRVLSVSYLEVE